MEGDWHGMEEGGARESHKAIACSVTAPVRLLGFSVSIIFLKALRALLRDWCPPVRRGCVASASFMPL